MFGANAPQGTFRPYQPSEPQPRGAVTRGAVARRRSRASGSADRGHRPAQIGEGITDRNQPVFTLMHVSPTARIALAVVRINRESAELLPCR